MLDVETSLTCHLVTGLNVIGSSPNTMKEFGSLMTLGLE